MRIFSLAASVVVAVLFCYSATKIIAEAESHKKTLKSVNSQIESLNKKIEAVSEFKDWLPEELKSSYLSFFNNMKLLAAFNNVSSLVTIPECQDRMNIERYFRESSFEGVKAVYVEADFYKIKRISDFISVLGALVKLQQEETLEIIEVSQDKDCLKFYVKLYGI